MQRANSLEKKDPDAGDDWRQEEKRVTEEETVQWHHWLIGHKFMQTPGDSGGQRSLACHSPWGHIELMWLSNWTTKTMVGEPLWGGDIRIEAWMMGKRQSSLDQRKDLRREWMSEPQAQRISGIIFPMFKETFISVWHKYSQWGGGLYYTRSEREVTDKHNIIIIL